MGHAGDEIEPRPVLGGSACGRRQAVVPGYGVERRQALVRKPMVEQQLAPLCEGREKSRVCVVELRGLAHPFAVLVEIEPHGVE